MCVLLQHPLLYRSDSADYRGQGPDVDSGVEAGSDMTPPTPAFPISPPTPYGKAQHVVPSLFNQLVVTSFVYQA